MQNKKTNPVRPFSMEYTEAKNKILRAINEAVQVHGVPFYLLEEVVATISIQVQECARNEREQARIAYEKRLAEHEKEIAEG